MATGISIMRALVLLASASACTATLERHDDRNQGHIGDGDWGNGDPEGTGAGSGLPSTGTGASPSHGTGGTAHPGEPGSGTGGIGSTGGTGSIPSAGGSASSSGGTSSGSGGADSGPPCKRGISFDRWVNQPSLADLDVLSPSVHWFYNWQYTQNPDIAGGYQSRGFEWVPMVRDGGVDMGDANSKITSDASYLLGFNEPNIRGNGGVDMTVEQVVALWPQLESIAENHDLTLVSPALTFTNISGERNGPEWLDRFFELCPTCRVDAVAIHSYTCEARWVADHIEPYRKFGLPIWVTEFACITTDTNLIRNFLEDTVDLLENDPDVARYAWFMSRSGNLSLLGGSGELTPLGQVYVNLPEAKPCPN